MATDANDRAIGAVDTKAFPILYVDDEPENLRVFELTFRRDFDILTAESGEAALEILNQHPVAVILSDHKMPGMTGVEFLARARDMAPETIRMLVTAYGSAETLAHAINDGSIYRYVAKPWEPEEMRVAIQRGLEVFRLKKNHDGLIRELQTVNRIAETISRELSMEPLLDLLVSSLTQVLDFDGASLLLFHGSGQRLTFERVVPSDEPASDALVGRKLERADAPDLFEAFELGRAQFLHLDDCFDQPTAIQEWLTDVAADVLAVPMIGKDGALGVIAVDNRRGGGSFASADLTLVEGIAQQATVAIQNARTVADLRRSRQQVLRADRLGTLGTLAAGFAHEINNPLTSIHTFLSLAPQKRNEADENFWGDYYELTCSEVDRIRNLVSTMSRLGREDEKRSARAACSLEKIAGEARTVATPEADRAGVAIEIAADANVPKVVAVREHLHQLVLNLTLNAIHASPPDGVVTLRIEAGGPGDQDGVTISVMDRGKGIAEENLDRIFDPFFTTKGPDRGTGLGLMICHRIVTEHEGRIEVSSGSGGSVFRVQLPMAEERREFV